MIGSRPIEIGFFLGGYNNLLLTIDFVHLQAKTVERQMLR